MKTYQAELLTDPGCVLAECPVYDEAKHGLYWLDIEKNRIYYLDLSAQRYLYTQMDRKIGSIVPTDRGRLLAGMDDGVYLIDRLRYELYCMIPESFGDTVRFNDGKCDPQGRFVAGTTAVQNSAGLGGLFSVENIRGTNHTDVRSRYQVLYTGLGCSNGLAWSADGRTMYHVDTLVETPSRITAADYDPATGKVRNRRDIIDFSKEAGQGILADGMAIDRDGHLWIAEWNGYGVGCWDPETGRKIARVEVPAEKVSSCAFGGRDYTVLFITTAAGKGLHGGGVFFAQADTAGYAAVKYREQT